jgi:HK97 family phage prohead protease
METRELRFFQASLRAEQGQAGDPTMTLRGMAATYNTVSKDLGGFREVIKPGAFAKVLASNPDVRCLFNHDASRVLGRCANGTLQLRDTPEGLAFSCKLDPNNSQHRDLYSSIKRGDIDACSFAFKLEDGDDDYSVDHDEEGRAFNKRTIRNFSHVYDVSVVTHPAYDGTSVGARALSLAARNAMSFEQQIFLRTGKEYVSDQQLRVRLELQSIRLQEDAIRIRAADILAAEARERFLQTDDPAALRERLARIEERAGGCLTAQGVGTDAVPARKPDYCVGGSLSANADDHEKAAAEHRCLAQRCKTAKRADLHYAAADAHALAAQTDENDDDYAERCNRAVGACQRASLMEEYA